MKQITITPDIQRLISNAVGPDVDSSKFAIFEAIALNTLPLPGKDGTLFEKARISQLTLQQMADSINSGKHLPLISNHDTDDTPKGRVFYAEVLMSDMGDPELRTLFYIDETEETIRAKLNAGSLDEVSVSFLASQILCSECGFDYRGEDATYSHLAERTCENGHTIGESGVHARLVGLSVFTELSLVSRGAADTPKIVGKSQSKLAAPLQQLAAKGFEVDKLYLSASRGENRVDMDKLVTDLSDAKAQVTVLTASDTAAKAQVTTLEASNADLTTRLEAAETALEEAKAASKQTELDAANTELTEAKAVLGDIFTRLATAAGEKEPTVPETIADIKLGIEKHQSKLTAILPTGGRSVDENQEQKPEVGAKFNAARMSGFKSNL